MWDRWRWWCGAIDSSPQLCRKLHQQISLHNHSGCFANTYWGTALFSLNPQWSDGDKNIQKPFLYASYYCNKIKDPLSNYYSVDIQLFVYKITWEKYLALIRPLCHQNTVCHCNSLHRRPICTKRLSGDSLPPLFNTCVIIDYYPLYSDNLNENLQGNQQASSRDLWLSSSE